MGMLKMRRSSEDSTGSKGVKEGNGGGGNGAGALVKKSSGERVKERNGEGEVEDMETESSSGKVQETLVDKFKKGKLDVKNLHLFLMEGFFNSMVQYTLICTCILSLSLFQIPTLFFSCWSRLLRWTKLAPSYPSTTDRTRKRWRSSGASLKVNY